MNVSCPNCGKQLRLSDKFRANLQNLKADQKARVKCTQCAQPFQIDGSVLQKGAPSPARRKTLPQSGVKIKPPSPPDVSWLKDGVFEGQEVVEEIPLALVLMPEGEARKNVVKAVEGLGYRAELSDSVDAAIEKMEFVNYSSVILHADFEPEGLGKGKFHTFMCTMSMTRRRYIFFAIIGKDLHTLFDLEALAYSANIVVNDQDVPYFGTILRKAIPDYESLFGPLMEELRVLGK